MSTATLNPPRNILARLEAEAAEEQATERTLAAAELSEISATLQRITPDLASAVNAAQENLIAVRKQAEAAIAKAEHEFRSAEFARRQAVGPLEARDSQLRRSLACELRPQCITDAFQVLEEIEGKQRHISDGFERAGQIMAWVASARQRLTALQFTEGDHTKTVETIFASQP